MLKANRMHRTKLHSDVTSSQSIKHKTVLYLQRNKFNNSDIYTHKLKKKRCIYSFLTAHNVLLTQRI